MANITDPLIRAIQGSDPQNLMEYITRQKIYDSRFWKEECFGLAAVDVLEKAATLKCIGGLPTKFLSLTLKLLQLQPDADDIVESFIHQDEFKYVRALGALYLRLTGRPADIYHELEPLYRDYRKLRCHLYQKWTLGHMDEFIHSLLTETMVLGITLPRLPARTTLQEAGYIDEGPRPTALRDVILDAGGPLEFLTLKMEEQNSAAAKELYETRYGVQPDDKKPKQKTKDHGEEEPRARKEKRKHSSSQLENEDDDEAEEGEVSPSSQHDNNKVREKPKKKKKKEKNYGSLFKDKSSSKAKQKNDQDKDEPQPQQEQPPPDENSEEYWNEQRAKLGLKALK